VTVSMGSSNSSGHLLFPPYTANPTHDYDGDLTGDGAWTYTWDGENRLKAMYLSSANIPVASRWRLEFGYDYLGRRTQKVVKDGNGAVLSTRRYLYDGWRLLAEVDEANAPVRTCLWGLDLSGSLPDGPNNAGGIGGLVAITDHAAPMSTHFPAYDGNGNVAALVKADGTLSARYEYSPFGELIRATGPMARTNPFRFSTKYWDEESGLVYYGERYYNPTLGRWISRDPIEEEGGNNLYAFNWNDPINQVDPTGLTSGTLAEEDAVIEEGAGMDMAMDGASQAFGIYQRIKGAVQTFNMLQRNLANLMDGDISEEDLAQALGDIQDIFVAKLTGAALGSISKFGGAKLGVSAAKRGPKPGMKGPHNQTVNNHADQLEAKGNVIVAGGKRPGLPERVVPTPGGAKNSRRPDIVYRTQNGAGPERGVNIGKVKANGAPVPREVTAARDIAGYGGLPMDPLVPYNR
jgi:RHS repeat-associated protein